MRDHERIYLEPAPGADEEYGRQWCQHNVWGDEATEYVHADLHDPLSSELDRLREALEFYADELTWADTNPKDDGRLTVLVPSPSFAEIDRGERARSALSPDNSTQKKEG